MMKILNTASFRTRIIITLIVLVAVVSSFSIYIYNKFLLDKIYKNSEQNVENVLYFLRDEIINIHDGRLIVPLLKNVERDKRVMQVYLFDANGNLKFPDPDSIKTTDTMDFKGLMASDREIQVITSAFGRNPSSLAFLHIHNRPVCHNCHSAEIGTLGYMAINFSLKDTRSTQVYMRNFSIIFTIFIVFIILGFIMLMHYRFIKQSLSRFEGAIQFINEGDLNQRVIIKDNSELSNLGHSFNQMLVNFQQAQRELTQYHQKELESAGKLATIGEMAARLAHDVRNPLTGIANSIEIIVADMHDSPNRPILEEIKRQTARVNVAINNLLKFSRTAEIKKNRGNINILVDNLVFFLRSQKQNSKLTFNLVTDPGIPEIDYDPEQMENVLMNLCINAIQALRYEGTVTIITSFDKITDMVQISIEDNGPGIPADVRDSIFKPFFTTRTEGTGLGLAISKDIIEKHNGRIWFECKQEAGTVFFISLPVNSSRNSSIQ